MEPKAGVANPTAYDSKLSAADGLRRHWPEYLMEAGEAGCYLFSACALATLLWHPASPLQPYLPTNAVRRLLMGVAMGASASFMTPFANGVSLMVYGPGGYRFGDFWKLGLPVTIWALIVTVVVVPVYWKF